MDMKNIMDNAYINYNEKIQIDSVIIIIALWNKLIENGRMGYKVYSNDRKFFKDNFEDTYDTAWAVSAGNYQWTDEFVYVTAEGHLMSFSSLKDENSPVDLDEIEISSLIRELQAYETQERHSNISPAIHEALQEI